MLGGNVQSVHAAIVIRIPFQFIVVPFLKLKKAHCKTVVHTRNNKRCHYAMGNYLCPIAINNRKTNVYLRGEKLENIGTLSAAIQRLVYL